MNLENINEISLDVFALCFIIFCLSLSGYLPESVLDGKKGIFLVRIVPLIGMISFAIWIISVIIPFLLNLF